MQQFIIFLFALVFSVSAYTKTYSQNTNFNTLYFCEGVDNYGYPVNYSDNFYIGREGGYLYLLFRLYNRVGCYSVQLKAYRNGTYTDTFYIDVKPDWNWFWKNMEFYTPGKYTFYLYDCDGYLLVSDSVYIEYR